MFEYGSYVRIHPSVELVDPPRLLASDFDKPLHKRFELRLEREYQRKQNSQLRWCGEMLGKSLRETEFELAQSELKDG